MKIIIEIEARVKEIQQQLNEVQKRVDKLEARGQQHRRRRKREFTDESKESKLKIRQQQDLNKAYEQAIKHQTRFAKITRFIKSDVSQTAKDFKAIAKYDVGKGFLGGLARGTGLAGLYQSIRGQPGGPGWRQRLGGAIGRGVVGLGARGLSWGLGAMQQAYQTYMQFGAAKWGMAGLGAGRRDRALARGTFGAGVGMGFTPTETAQMAPGVAAATGHLGAVTTAQKFAMGGGFGPGRAGEAVQYMGTMTRAGHKWTGEGTEKSLSRTIALGMYSGLEKARLPEFYEGVRGLVERQFSTSAGKVDSVNIARQLAVLGKAGGVGFQGARGAQIMGQLDQMIKGPGAGEAGQAMILQAMGFGKPGGKTNYYEALTRQQEGIRDPENIRRVMKEVYSQRGVVEAGGADPRNREANLQFSLLSGLSIKQTEKLKDIYSSNKTMEDQDKEAQEVIDEAKSLQEQALAASKDGFAAIKRHIATVEAMQIRAGSVVAEPMMKLQKLQMDALVELSKYFPKMIKILTEIWEVLKEIGLFVRDWFRGIWKDKTEEKMKQLKKEFESDIALIKGRVPKTILDVQKAAGARGEVATRALGMLEPEKRKMEEAKAKGAGYYYEEGAGYGALVRSRFQIQTARQEKEAADQLAAASASIREHLKAAGYEKAAIEGSPAVAAVSRKLARVDPSQAQQMASIWGPELVAKLRAQESKESAREKQALEAVEAVKIMARTRGMGREAREGANIGTESNDPSTGVGRVP